MGESQRRKKLGLSHKTPLKIDLAKVSKTPNSSAKNGQSKGLAFFGFVHTSLRDAAQVAIAQRRVTYIRLGKRTLSVNLAAAKEIVSLFKGNPIDFVVTEFFTFCIPYSVSKTNAANQISPIVSDLDLRRYKRKF